MKTKLALLAFLATSIGCGRSEITSVTGRITLDGKPLDGVALLFWHEGGPANEGLGGIANANGEFAIPTDNAETPVHVGTYRVVVQDPHNMAAMMVDFKAVSGAPKGTLPTRTPLKYCYRDQTPLMVELGYGANTLAPFELVKD